MLRPPRLGALEYFSGIVEAELSSRDFLHRRGLDNSCVKLAINQESSLYSARSSSEE